MGGVREATKFFITRREERQPIGGQQADDPSCKRYGEKMKGERYSGRGIYRDDKKRNSEQKKQKI